MVVLPSWKLTSVNYVLCFCFIQSVSHFHSEPTLRKYFKIETWGKNKGLWTGGGIRTWLRPSHGCRSGVLTLGIFHVLFLILNFVDFYYPINKYLKSGFKYLVRKIIYIIFLNSACYKFIKPFKLIKCCH